MIDSKYTNASKIEEHLFVGNRIAAQDFAYLTENKIAVVLNMSNHPFPLLEDTKHEISYYHFPLHENLEKESEADVVQQWQRAADVLAKCQHDKLNVLVACMAGVNRSACTVLYYMLKRNGAIQSFPDVYKAVNKARPCIHLYSWYRCILECIDLKHRGACAVFDIDAIGEQSLRPTFNNKPALSL
jgi:protein-tyrosine phosphatase